MAWSLGEHTPKEQRQGLIICLTKVGGIAKLDRFRVGTYNDYCDFFAKIGYDVVKNHIGRLLVNIAL